MTRKTIALISMAMAAIAVPALAQDAPDVDCNNAQTQMEMNYCVEQDFDKADAALNKAYKRAMASQKKVDADVKETMGEESIGAVAALKKAQRAWIDYRDGQCDGLGFQARGGTMEPMLVMGCKAELSTARAKELDTLAKGMEN
ncbi:uncharacterized protein YecT (DUF1311 family) [Rhizobium sp. SG_E_25_P2]|uniref:lysozyme inhibitor LprI family protein n=1 Tax=Rhizobium sp. SG_E_25_P2 TaxID=2879942 RepID=UPI002474296B|nr:lysozyme inhibitor LprI family protein [Rhizobium sp. SG_E_25_P2]MDH6265715.1 uncharacterized protein YecT (DUF1311 family) [Rhizobium sp. SG_E_25_P2]